MVLQAESSIAESSGRNRIAVNNYHVLSSPREDFPFGKDGGEQSDGHLLPLSTGRPTGYRTDEDAEGVQHVQLTRGESASTIYLVLTPLAAAFVASIAYVDPGNFATNIQAGSQFGYTLLWVVLLANIMAMQFQYLSAKLGIASGMNLGRCCRERFHPVVNFALWGIAEIAALATDIAEFVGASVGLQILLGIPLIWGGVITAVTTFSLLLVRDRGLRIFEGIVVAFVSVIAICYIIETVLDHPDWKQVGYHLVVPSFDGADSALLAVGIVGATVMPHAIYLHSALVLARKQLSTVAVSKTFRFELVAIIAALGTAGFVNIAVLVMAASAFYDTGKTDVATMEEAHETLTPILGSAASFVFAIGLVASGISSSAIGTLAGQIIMEGFLRYRMSVWLRRLVTLFPSLAVILSGVEPTRALVFSQVVLSFCIPFALVPLLFFTNSEAIVGIEWRNYRITTITASSFALIIIGLNAFLVYSTFS